MVFFAELGVRGSTKIRKKIEFRHRGNRRLYRICGEEVNSARSRGSGGDRKSKYTTQTTPLVTFTKNEGHYQNCDAPDTKKRLGKGGGEGLKHKRGPPPPPKLLKGGWGALNPLLQGGAGHFTLSIGSSLPQFFQPADAIFPIGKVQIKVKH